MYFRNTNVCYVMLIYTFHIFQAATQFKSSLSQLMDILMIKEPSYVRCIKPNDYKRAQQFEEKIVHHQVKYLGLMENLRVRRAGFAYRRPYKVFLKRYKTTVKSTAVQIYIGAWDLYGLPQFVYNLCTFILDRLLK